MGKAGRKRERTWTAARGGGGGGQGNPELPE
ncbi:rCG32195 [Rattus norvegicus]|uniref:RCG32195 n=1 Tax=Rattus norvegicus TaxID=10116 RepID=A6JXM8_RAT|nr:rCG32195 [Rattus norvegicus]